MPDNNVTVAVAAPANDDPKGWSGHLSLGFALRQGRTVLVRRRHQGPFMVQRAFYPESDLPHVYLLHPPGGVVGGDSLTLDVCLQQGSHALLTMPGATKFYRSAGPIARLTQHFTLAQGSTLEWLPQGNIFFPYANVHMDTVFSLAAGARLIGFETHCLGRPVLDESFIGGTLDARLRIALPASCGLSERLGIIDGALDIVGGFPLCGTLFAYPVDPSLLEKVRERLGHSALPAAGATLIDDLLMVRLLDHDNQRLQGLLHAIWTLLRPAMLGRNAIIPRIWAT